MVDLDVLSLENHEEGLEGLQEVSGGALEGLVELGLKTLVGEKEAVGVHWSGNYRLVRVIADLYKQNRIKVDIS